MGIRAHIGSGTVYLLPDANGPWVNVDLWQSGAALAKDCPAGVRKWGTTEDRYYANHAHIDDIFLGKGTPDHETTVCDAYGSWSNLPFEDWSVSEIVSRQTFEHLSKTESRYALAEARRVLQMGGILRLDVPDHAATLGAAYEAKAAGQNDKSDFLLRHLLGSQKNDWAFHMGSWTKAKLVEFCRAYGFALVSEEPNIHFYPAFCLRFQKQPTCDFPELDEVITPWKAAYEYCGKLPGSALCVPDDAMVLEVGPGNAPWPRANASLDIEVRDLPNFALGRVEDIPFDDGAFDYVFCSHCLEHSEDPLKACAELSRVARAGCVVCPSPFKEGLFLAHEWDHKWWVMASGDTLVFKRIPAGMYAAVYNAELSGQMHRTWRYGDRRLEGLCNKAKRWFHEKEVHLDVIHHWEGTLSAIVLE